MDPQEQEHTPSFELPPAHTPEPDGQAVSEQGQTAKSEKQGNIALEHGVSQQYADPAAAQFAAPPQQQSATSQVPLQADGAQPAALPSGWMPPIADDGDLIEKEWVLKAKEIVARTAHDPHLQNREINKFKADYLKKRYNKEIKLSEDT
jgi:hypothetical protein